MKAVLLSVLLLTAVPAAYPQGLSDPVGEAVSSQLRMLVQRASRQYMMYQYGAGELAVSKEPLLETVTRVNEILKRLMAGDGAAGAPPEILAQSKLVDEKWRTLEKIYTYQPYMLYQAKELLPASVRKQDPVLVRYVDRLAQELLVECGLLIESITRQCEAAGSTECESQVRDAGTQMLLVEEVSNSLLFTVLDIDRSDRSKLLEQKAQQLQASFDRSSKPGHYGENPSVLIGPLLETISLYWNQVKASVDLALRGKEEEVEVAQMLRSQRRLLEEIDSLTSILAGR